MTTIIGIAGSLRKKSFNKALLQAAVELAPEHVTMEIGSIEGIPLYNGDVEAEQGVPDVVEALKDRIARADGLLLVTPEYNHSIPGVFKNAIDWLSRPPSDIGSVFRNKPVGLIGATPGMRGTIYSQNAWLPVFRTLGMRPWFGKMLYVGHAGKVFNEEHKLVDEQIRELLTQFMEGFAAFVTEEASLQR